jgi:hypothetical protein
VVFEAGDASLSSTSKRRPSSELPTAFSFLSAPSDSVPGAGEDGRGSSSQCSGGSRGPDCFSKLLHRVLSIRNRDLVVMLFPLEVPYVICTCTADI